MKKSDLFQLGHGEVDSRHLIYSARLITLSSLSAANGRGAHFYPLWAPGELIVSVFYGGGDGSATAAVEVELFFCRFGRYRWCRRWEGGSPDPVCPVWRKNRRGRRPTVKSRTQGAWFGLKQCLNRAGVCAVAHLALPWGQAPHTVSYIRYHISTHQLVLKRLKNVVVAKDTVLKKNAIKP